MTKTGAIKICDPWNIGRQIIGVKGMLCVMLAFLLGTVVTTCAPIGVRTEGVSGPVAWEATDLRLVKRKVDGTPMQLYAFTLVLKETQGRGITFTHIKRHITSLEADIYTAEDSIDWQLRPHGELRRPCSYGIRAIGPAARDFRPISVAWIIILTGRDDQNRPVRISININLPSKPPVQQATQATHPSTAAHLTQPTIVPVSFVSNVILVSAILAGKERATLLLDTGASRTAITPEMATQLGISPTEEAPRVTIVVFGGRKIKVPVVELSSIQVGDAAVKNLKVGVSVVNPDAPLVDGVLGGDFLGHFTVTVDRHASRLRLVSHGKTVEEELIEMEAERRKLTTKDEKLSSPGHEVRRKQLRGEKESVEKRKRLSSISQKEADRFVPKVDLRDHLKPYPYRLAVFSWRLRTPASFAGDDFWLSHVITGLCNSVSKSKAFAPVFSPYKLNDNCGLETLGDDSLERHIMDRLWETGGMFSSAKPNIDLVAHIGRQLNVHTVLMYELLIRQGPDDLVAFLIDVKNKETYSAAGTTWDFKRDEGAVEIERLTNQVFADYENDQVSKPLLPKQPPADRGTQTRDNPLAYIPEGRKDASVRSVSNTRHDIPDIKVGMFWKYTTWSVAKQKNVAREEVVENINDEMITLIVYEKGRTYKKFVNRELRRISPNGSFIALNRRPSAIPFDFPLFIGKTWTDAYEGRVWTGERMYRYENKYEVVAYEEVHTKGGTFWAYRIEKTNHNLDTNSVHRVTYWYAPEVSSRVRYETTWGTSGELLSYGIKKQTVKTPKPMVPKN
jgi:hypothetical protein